MRAVQTIIVLNPTAGSGRAKAAGLALARRLPGSEIQETESRGAAVRIARSARMQGVDLIVAVGGDGTIQECVTGLCFEDDGSRAFPRTRLAVLPAGTGGDFRKTYDFTGSIDQAEARVRDLRPRAIDVGRVEYTDPDGKRTATACANVLSFGIGGLTDRLVENSPKWIGGRAAFFWGAVRATLIHQPVPIELFLDGKLIETAPYSNVAVCNGRFFGGGMQIAPDASPSDGLFDIITMELSRTKTLTLASAIYQGSHLKRRGVTHYRGARLEARSARSSECLIDVDGEQLGTLPLAAEVLPGAFELLT